MIKNWLLQHTEEPARVLESYVCSLTPKGDGASRRAIIRILEYLPGATPPQSEAAQGLFVAEAECEGMLLIATNPAPTSELALSDLASKLESRG